MTRLVLLLLFGAAVWLPGLHHFERLGPKDRAALGAQLAERETMARVDDVDAMRGVNPEWDFMRRTSTVLALSRRARAIPAERTRNLAAIDAIIAGTLALAKDQTHFMLPYAKARPFRDPEAGSLFVSGEIVAMIAARELVEPRDDLHDEARLRALGIYGQLRSSPSLSGESYPDECWTFCNTTALAGLAMLDRVEGTAHYAALASDWVEHAKAHLVDPRTGLLVSSYTWDGRTLDGPEGSSIWMSATNLLEVDEAFARDQYARARKELGVSFLGFGWAREWPRGVPARPDVDSGPIVPVLDASAGSSGLAFLGASAFGDTAFLDALFASVELAAFRDPATGRYRAGNEVGDAVMLYALSFEVPR